MRTVAATRQAPQADLASEPQGFTWLVHLRDNAKQLKLSKIQWALAAILPTFGQGQNITISIKGLADILDSDRETVGNALKGLVAKGLVTTVGPGRHNKNVYRLTLPRCRSNRQSGVGLTDSGVSVSPTVSVGQTDTTSRTHQEVDEQLTSTSGDDAASAPPSGENRAKGSARSTSTRATKASPAKDDHAPLEEYVADLEECRDELARRLGVDPGSITVKPLAKKAREMAHRNGQEAGLSAAIKEFPAGDPMWSMCASKANPVGFFLFAVGQYLQGNDVRAHYKAPAPVPAVDDDLAGRVVGYLTEHGSDREDSIYRAVGSNYDAIRPVLGYLVDIGKIIRSEEREGIYYFYKLA